MDLYIYYRVRCEHAADFQACAIKMQTILAKEYSLTMGLKRRPDAKDDRHTWMEVYQNVPENFDTILQHAVIHAGLTLLIDGERHLEYFLDLSACA